MEIRPAQVSDIPHILSLLRQVGQVHHGIRPDLFRSGACKYDAEALTKLMADPARPVFVAQDGTVTGYCFCILRQYNNDPALTDRKELYIDDLCVDENHHRMGVASALYRHALDYAKAAGCSFVTLNVWEGNDGARRFYEQMGLRPRSITMETSTENEYAD